MTDLLEHQPRVLASRPITPRQLDVLRLKAHGLSDRQVAAQLWITENTVKHHLKLILMNTGCRNTTQAVVLAVREGLI